MASSEACKAADELEKKEHWRRLKKEPEKDFVGRMSLALNIDKIGENEEETREEEKRQK